MGQRRSTILGVRLSIEEREILERFAAAEGLGIGTTMRRYALLAARQLLRDERDRDLSDRNETRRDPAARDGEAGA